MRLPSSLKPIPKVKILTLEANFKNCGVTSLHLEEYRLWWLTCALWLIKIKMRVV